MWITKPTALVKKNLQNACMFLEDFGANYWKVIFGIYPLMIFELGVLRSPCLAVNDKEQSVSYFSWALPAEVNLLQTFFYFAALWPCWAWNYMNISLPHLVNYRDIHRDEIYYKGRMWVRVRVLLWESKNQFAGKHQPINNRNWKYETTSITGSNLISSQLYQ